MNNKKTSGIKMFFRVLGIIFSIVLIPGLILWVPAGGIAMGVARTVSKDNLSRVVTEAELSSYVLDMVEDEVVKGITSDEVKPEFLQDVVRGCFTKEWIDEVIAEVFEATYSGTRPEISMAPITDKIQATVEEITENGFSDLYSVWKNDTPSKYFTDSFVDSFVETVEEEVLKQYTEYDANSLEELEQKYDSAYGEGAFAKVLDEKVMSLEGEWDQKFAEKANEGLAGLTAEAEEELNDEVYKILQEPDLRETVDLLQKLDQKAQLLQWIVYGVIFGAILLLVGCFWFGISGFVVSAIPMVIGGVLCKVIGGLGQWIFRFVNEFVEGEAALADFTPVIDSVSKSLINPLLDGVSKMGNTALIIGVALIGLAILRGVLNKNKAVEE